MIRTEAVVGNGVMADVDDQSLAEYLQNEEAKEPSRRDLEASL